MEVGISKSINVSCLFLHNELEVYRRIYAATSLILKRDPARCGANLRNPSEPICDGGNTESVTGGDLTVWAQLERGFDALSGEWIGLNRRPMSKVIQGESRR